MCLIGQLAIVFLLITSVFSNENSTKNCSNHVCSQRTPRGRGGGLGGLGGGGGNKGNSGLDLLWLFAVLMKVSILKVIAVASLVLVLIIKKIIMGAAILLPVFLSKLKAALRPKHTYVYVNNDDHDHDHDWYKRQDFNNYQPYSNPYYQ